MFELSAEQESRASTMSVAQAWGELLHQFVRAQDSDLRLLELVDAHAETEQDRDLRIASEVCSQFPSLDRDLVTRWVGRATQFQRRYVAEPDALQDFASASYGQAVDLANELGLGNLSVRFVWHLLRASADDPDRARMLGVVLVGFLASFEGWLHGVARFASRLEPERVASKTPLERPFAPEYHVTGRYEHEDAVEARLAHALRGGWSDWRKVLRRDFGLELPEQSETLRVAYDLRRYAAHRGGFFEFTMLEDDGIGVVSPVTPDDIQAVADDLLLAACELSFAAMWATTGVTRSDQWGRLSELRYQLLVRRRYEVCTRTLHLDPQGLTHWTERRGADVNRWIALERLGRRSEYLRDLARWPADLRGSVEEVVRDLLRGKRASATRNARSLLARGVLKEDQWLTWPLFDEIRPGS